MVPVTQTLGNKIKLRDFTITVSVLLAYRPVSEIGWSPRYVLVIAKHLLNSTSSDVRLFLPGQVVLGSALNITCPV